MILYWGLFYAFMVFVVGIAFMDNSHGMITPFGIFFSGLHVIIFAFLMNWFQKIDAKDKEARK